MSSPPTSQRDDAALRRSHLALGLIAIGAAAVLALTLVSQLDSSSSRHYRLVAALASLAFTGLLLAAFVVQVLRRLRRASALTRVDAALERVNAADRADVDRQRTVTEQLESLASAVAVAVHAQEATLLLVGGAGTITSVTGVGTPAEATVDQRATAPLVSDGLPLGSVEVHVSERTFGPADRLVLDLMAPRIGSLVVRARLEEAERRSRLEAEQARRQVNMLARASVPLAPGLEHPEETVREIAGIVVPEFADLFALDLVREGGRLERIVATYSDAATEASFADLESTHPAWQDALRRVMEQGVSALAFSTNADEVPPDGAHGAFLHALGMQSWVVAPLRVRGTSIGTMTLATARDRRGYRESDRTTIDDLVARSAIAFERALLYREARQATDEALHRADQLARMVEEAQSREQRLQALIEASPLGILEFDQAGTVLVANPAARTLFPPAADRSDELVQIPPDLASGLADLVTATVRGERREVELSSTGTAGEERALWVSTAPVSDEGGDAARILAVITDMTGRKRLEEQLALAQRFEAIATLAGGVAHDFNNLLTVILGYSEILLHGLGADSPDREPVEAIQEAGNHAAVITNQLLTLSRHQVLQPEIIDAVARGAALVPMLRRIAGSSIEIEARFEGSAQIKVDPGQLEQVLFNLVFNSRDAMPQGGHLTVEMGRRPGPAGRDVLFVWVTDDGDGMDAATLARCQEPFFTTKGRSRGIGLGLATVASILERSGATLEMTSELGLGTSSTVLFPIVEIAEPAIDRSAQPAGRRVLLVDDDEHVRHFAAQVLTASSYEVVEVGDGESAIRMIEAGGRYDLLITDVELPAMSGASVVRTVHERWPAMACVLITGYADVQSVDGELGDTALVPKPFTREELVRAADGAWGARPAVTSGT